MNTKQIFQLYVIAGIAFLLYLAFTYKQDKPLPPLPAPEAAPALPVEEVVPEVGEEEASPVTVIEEPEMPEIP